MIDIDELLGTQNKARTTVLDDNRDDDFSAILLSSHPMCKSVSPSEVQAAYEAVKNRKLFSRSPVRVFIANNSRIAIIIDISLV